MKNLKLALVLLVAFAAGASAADLPSYYPKEGFKRAGMIDAVYLDEERIVINDVPYALSGSAVVHSLQSYSVSRTQLRPGRTVAFRLDRARRVITEVWLLPDNYDARKRR